MKTLRVGIVGGGAAGLVCAIQSARRGHDVVVFESQDRIGKKILQTGNGRCNFSNLNLDCSYYNKAEFVENVLNQVGLEEMLDFFNSIGLKYFSDEQGRMYPQTNQASSVLDVLRYECERLGVKVFTSKKVNQIEMYNNIFKIEDCVFDKIVLACGGSGFELAKQFGHNITPLRKGLVGLKTAKQDVAGLMGLRAVAKVKYGNYEEVGEVQFKVDGLGGICIFNISSLISRKNEKKPVIFIDFAPNVEKNILKKEILKRIKKLKDENIQNIFVGIYNRMLGQMFLKRSKIENTILCKELKDEQIDNLVDVIKNCLFEIVDMYDNPQVTVGGIDVNELNYNLESKLVKNLYLVGECVDIDGLCGGYNLSWAWASGLVVGKN